MRQSSQRWLCSKAEGKIVPVHRGNYRSCTHPDEHEENDKSEMGWKTDTECPPSPTKAMTVNVDMPPWHTEKFRLPLPDVLPLKPAHHSKPLE